MRICFGTNVLVGAFPARGLCADLLRLVLREHSLLTPGVLGPDRLPAGPSQITDAHLLALAVDHGGSLVTLDRRLRADLVAGGAAALEVLDGV